MVCLFFFFFFWTLSLEPGEESAHKPSSGHPRPSSNLVRRKWNCSPWPTKGGNNRVVGTKMRFKSQAQAALAGRGRGKIVKSATRQYSRAEHDTAPPHDTSRHDLTDPSALVQICAPVYLSPLSLSPALCSHTCVHTHTQGPIQISITVAITPPSGDTATDKCAYASTGHGAKPSCGSGGGGVGCGCPSERLMKPSPLAGL